MSSSTRKNRSSARGLGGRPESLRVRFGFVLILVLALARISDGAKITLPVIRSFSQVEGSGVNDSRGMTPEHAAQLKHHDLTRSRILTSVADFPLGGNYYSVGLYYTEIGLGTPSEAYFVTVDTGSNLLWVNCSSCSQCPSRSTLPIDLSLYNPASSTTSSNISCTSSVCTSLVSSAEEACIDNSCYYGIGYGDGSTTVGYLVSDNLTYSVVGRDKSLVDVSTKVVFGCGVNQTGASLTSTIDAVDGIMGFGREAHSVVSQLAEGNFTTNEFAHCLEGSTGEGGIFVIGNVHEPGLVFTPIVPKSSHYNVRLKNISVGGTVLKINSSAFDTVGANGGTIFDSGTALALFVDEAYDAFLTQLLKVATARKVTLAVSPDTPCFQVTGSDLSAEFPNVTLSFEGGAMELDPTNYLIQFRSDSDPIWCLAWSKASELGLPSSIILGDIILKNRLVVYDLQNLQIGWKDYDCLSSVNVTIS